MSVENNKQNKQDQIEKKISENVKKSFDKKDDILIKELEEKIFNLEKDNDLYKEKIKSSNDNFNKLLEAINRNNEEIRKIQEKIEEDKNENRLALEEGIQGLLTVSEVNKVKEKIEGIFGFGQINTILKNKLLNKAREFVNYGTNNLNENNLAENNLSKSISIDTIDDFKTVVNKMSALFTMGNSEEKIYASRFFDNINAQIETEEGILENISKYRGQTIAAIGALGIGSAVGLGVISGPVGLGLAGLAGGVKYLGSNDRDREKIRKGIKNFWIDKMPGDTNLEKAEWAAGPIGWGIKAVRKSIGGILGLSKNTLKGGVVGAAAVGEITGGIPGLKGSLGKVTNGLTGKTFNKMFGN